MGIFVRIDKKILGLNRIWEDKRIIEWNQKHWNAEETS